MASMGSSAAMVNLHVTLLDKSKSKAVAGSASLDTCVWKFGEQVGMYALSTHSRSKGGYIFRTAFGSWKSNQHPTLTLADAGVQKTGDMVEFMGDFEPYTPGPVVPGMGVGPSSSVLTGAPMVNLHVTLMDKSKSRVVAGSASLDTCAWKFGEQVGMYTLTTTPESNCGYIVKTAFGSWKSNQHPTLTLADAGVQKTGDMVEFMGDFEPYTPGPAMPAMGVGTSSSVSRGAPMVNLHVTLMDKSKSKAVAGSASLDTCVWKFGEQVGMYTLSTSSKSKGGYIFRTAFGSWKSNQHPTLTLADAGVQKTGDMVEFRGDFDPYIPGPSAATTSLAPLSPAVATGKVVDLRVTVDALSKRVTKMCRVNLEKSVWAFGQDAGTAMLSNPAASGHVFSYAGHQWRSQQHPNLTLAEAGVHQNGEAVIFTADFQPVATSASSTAPKVEVNVTLLDKSKSWTTTGQADLEKCVWSFGDEVGMRRLTTGPLSNYGYVVRCGGREWRSNQHPNLTLADAGVTESSTLEFLGDFEPAAPRSLNAAALVELQVVLGEEEPVTCKTSLEKGVWRFGEEVGVQKLVTSSLSHFGYVFHLGEKTWRKTHHPNLTLVEAGVKEGDTLRFTGDFEPI